MILLTASKATTGEEGRQTASVSIAGGQTSDFILIGNAAENVTVGLVPAGGASGKAQVSASSVAALEAGTATWHDWSSGVVAVATIETWYGPIQAVRGVSAAGAVTLEVVV